MTHLNTTLERPSSPLLAAVGGLLVTGALIVGVAVSGLDLGGSDAGAPGVVAPRTNPAAIKAQLQSEYLHQISGGWYVATPGDGADTGSGPFYSEYLREIATGW